MEQRLTMNGVAGLKKYDVKVTGIVFMLYCLVGAGAFGIEEMIPEAGPGMTLILLIIFPVIWAYPISNLVAECGAVLPSEGGVYVWVREAFGEFWGFQAGWWGTVSTYIANGTYVSLVAGYVSQLIPMSPLADQVLKIRNGADIHSDKPAWHKRSGKSQHDAFRNDTAGIHARCGGRLHQLGNSAYDAGDTA